MSSRSFKAFPSAANPTTERTILVESSSPILNTFGSYLVLMLYPDVERVSPANIANVSPVIPNVEPPLSVYLESFISALYASVKRLLLTGRRHVVLDQTRLRCEVQWLLPKMNMMDSLRP